MIVKHAVLSVAAACLVAAPMSFAGTQKTNSNDNWAKENQSKTTENQNSTEHQNKVQSRVDHRVDYLSTVLSLTSSQKEQAKTIFTKAADENSSVMANLRTERNDLRKAIDSNEPNAKIQKLSDEIGNNVSKLVTNVASASEQFHNVLNPEQQNKMTQLEHEVHGWGMGMGLYGTING